MGHNERPSGIILPSATTHSGGEAVSYREALERDLARRAEWAARPETIRLERLKVSGVEARRRERLAAKGEPEVHGPPNPYRAHRKS